MCPQCGSYVDIRNFRIAGPFARSIQTQGRVHLTPDADVASRRILCGSVQIEGRFRGRILCTGEATVRFSGQYEGEVDSEKVIIHPKSDVEFLMPIHATVFEAEGKARGVICAQKVVIQKKGRLEGTVYARAITVEKGGIFSGSLIIGQELPPELRRPDERTWFAGGSNPENTPLPATEFGDLPPSGLAMDIQEEVLSQPQLEIQVRRPRKRKGPSGGSGTQ
jgi:cytoskeletal protein CcmA (bactofilin family)